MTTALAPRIHLPNRPNHHQDANTLDAKASVSVQALVGWLICQVGIILLLPWLPNTALGSVRMFILVAYWLTFSRVFRLRPLHDAALGVGVLGFEWLVDLSCGLPLSHGWAAVGSLWLVTYFDNATKRRVQSFLMSRCYTLLCASVYATTTTERLQSRYFGKLHRALAGLAENLRRSCAHRLCTLNAARTR